jgi:hypothetical protein
MGQGERLFQEEIKALYQRWKYSSMEAFISIHNYKLLATFAALNRKMEIWSR